MPNPQYIKQRSWWQKDFQIRKNNRPSFALTLSKLFRLLAAQRALLDQHQAPKLNLPVEYKMYHQEGKKLHQ